MRIWGNFGWFVRNIFPRPASYKTLYGFLWRISVNAFYNARNFLLTFAVSVAWLLLATGVDDNICLLSDSQDLMLGTQSRHNTNWLHNFPCRVTSSQFKGTLSGVNGEILKWLITQSSALNNTLYLYTQFSTLMTKQINLANIASCQESVGVSFRALKFNSNRSHSTPAVL